MTEKKQYKAESITVLKGLECKKKTSHVYWGRWKKGSSPPGLEVVDNSIDEAMAGHCSEITVELHEEGVICRGQRRGIPVDIHKEEGKSDLS